MFNDQLGLAEEYLAKLFGYDKVCFMNTGVEGGETAVKFARRWGYDVKKIPDNKAKVLFCNGNFWGRTIAACGSSDAPDRYARLGPFGGLGFELIDYNDAKAFEEKCKNDPYIAAFMVEPIQGEGGVVPPSPDYFTKVREICNKYKVLLILDEVQTGLGRTGKMLAQEHFGVRADITILGKALSGGILPVSCILADNTVMMNIHPGEHGSTYGGNPFAAKVAVESLKVLIEEHLVDNADAMGELLRGLLKCIKNPLLKGVRGYGLFNAIIIYDEETAWQTILNLIKRGLLTKTTHGNIIRLAPPLTITKEQVMDCAAIIEAALNDTLEQFKGKKKFE
jgi:ornithine--oxo-acid transaminase